MAKKWKQTGKENGLHIVVWDDGKVQKLTDSELHELQTGVQLTDKEAAKKLGAEIKSLKARAENAERERDDLQGQLNGANEAKEQAQTAIANLEREIETLKNDKKTLEQQVEDLKKAKPEAKVQDKPQERKDVQNPPETK